MGYSKAGVNLLECVGQEKSPNCLFTTRAVLKKQASSTQKVNPREVRRALIFLLKKQQLITMWLEPKVDVFQQIPAMAPLATRCPGWRPRGGAMLADPSLARMETAPSPKVWATKDVPFSEILVPKDFLFGMSLFVIFCRSNGFIFFLFLSLFLPFPKMDTPHKTDNFNVKQGCGIHGWPARPSM